jgi:hypothetical protein
MGNTMKKKINKKEVSVSERHFGVILEYIDSKLDLVVDGHQALDKKIDNNHEEFQEFRSEMDYKFEIVFDELSLIRGDLKQKVSRDEFALSEKRITALENRSD